MFFRYAVKTETLLGVIVKIGDVYLKNIKIAYLSLDELANSNSEFKNKSYNCTTALQKINQSSGVWSWDVRCGEYYSDPSGHTVNVQLLDDPNTVFDKHDIRAKVNCSCPAFLYYGSQYHLYNDGALYTSPGNPPRGLLVAPNKRDPAGKNLVCKHVYVALRRMLNKMDWDTAKKPEEFEPEIEEKEPIEKGPFTDEFLEEEKEPVTKVEEVEDILTPDDLADLNERPIPMRPGEEDLAEVKETDVGKEIEIKEEPEELPEPIPTKPFTVEEGKEEPLESLERSELKEDEERKSPFLRDLKDSPEGELEQKVIKVREDEEDIKRTEKPKRKTEKKFTVEESDNKDEPDSIKDEKQRLQNKQQEKDKDLESSVKTRRDLEESKRKRREEINKAREEARRLKEYNSIKKEDERRRKELEKAEKRQRERLRKKQMEDDAYDLEDKLTNDFNRSRRSFIVDMIPIIKVIE